MKKKIFALLLCLSLLLGYLDNFLVVLADENGLNNFEVDFVMKNYSKKVLSDLIWQDDPFDIVKSDFINWSKGDDTVWYEDGAIYRRIPVCRCKLSFIKDPDYYYVDVYAQTESGEWKKIGINSWSTKKTSYTNIEREIKLDWLSEYNENEIKGIKFTKGNEIQFKIVVYGFGVEEISKEISYRVPAKLHKAYIETCMKNNSIYFFYTAEGTHCQTQYRYKKGDKWKDIPKLCGKLKPVQKVSFKTDQTFYVRCRTSEVINGKKVYSPWSWITKVTPPEYY